MNQANAVKIANWLYEVWPYYLLNEHTRTSIPQSTDNPVRNKLRASKLHDCAKKVAAEQRKLIEKLPITLEVARKFDLGVRVAESVQEAIDFGVKQQTFPIAVTFESDNRHENEYMSGTPDCVLWVEGDCVPIEIKHTEAWEGFYWTQVLQIIGYMQLYNANCGILYTVNPNLSAEVSHNVYIVMASDDQEGWYLYDRDGKPVVSHSKFTSKTWNGTVYFTRFDYNEMVRRHQYWMDEIAKYYNTSMVPDDIDYMEDNRCGEFIQPQFYQRNQGEYKKGDQKPGTGVFKIRCPLAKYCYPELNIQDGDTEVVWSAK